MISQWVTECSKTQQLHYEARSSTFAVDMAFTCHEYIVMIENYGLLSTGDMFEGMIRQYMWQLLILDIVLIVLNVTVYSYCYY